MLSIKIKLFNLFKENAEADCFYCFTNLIGLEGVRENFVAALDDSQWGISNIISFFASFNV